MLATRPDASPSTLRLGNVLFHLRSFTPVPVIALILWRLATWHTSLSYGAWVGLSVAGWTLALLGQALRFYTLGQVPEGTSGQGNQLQATQLNTRGPYAHVRNPLYVGNLGICLGLMLMAHDPVIYVLGLGFFFGEYFFIIRAEEAFLYRQFGAAYEDFLARVPRWIPRLTPAYPGTLRLGFDLRRACFKEHNPFVLWAVGAVVATGFSAHARGTLTPTLRVGLAAVGAFALTAFVAIKTYKRVVQAQRRRAGL